MPWQAELAQFDVDPTEVEIFFSAHGVPESYVEEVGDPYKEEMEQCINFIMGELRVGLCPMPSAPGLRGLPGHMESQPLFSSPVLRKTLK